MCSMAMAQSWDYLKRELSLTNPYVTAKNDSIRTPIYGDKVVSGTNNGREVFTYPIMGYQSTYLPTPVYEEYKFGRKCYRTGSAFITLGSIMAVAGGICYLASGGNQTAKTAGEVLFVMGDVCITVSVPLLCFGDHMKREANWKYRMLK